MTVLLTMVGLLGSPAVAATLNVGVGQPYADVTDAVAAASDGDRIRIHSGTYTDTVVVDGLELTVTTAQGQGTVTLIGAAGGDAVFDLRGDAWVSFEGLILDGAHAAPTVRVAADAHMESIDTVHQSGAAADGGCVDASAGGWVEITRGQLGGCDATGTGGAVAVGDGGQLVITDASLVGNHAGADGGAVWCAAAADCSVTGAVLVSNRADGDGGGLWLGGSPSVDGVLLALNQATRGGGLALEGGALRQSVLCENSATAEGGGLLVLGDSEVHDDHFVGNTSALGGAAVRALAAADVVDVLFLANAGGGPVLDGDGDVTLAYSWFHDNTTSDDDVGGGSSTTHGGDPLLVDPRPGDCLGSDFGLQPGSPLVDAGSPSAAFDDPDGSRADIGAFDPSWDATIDSDDFDGDGVVDADDCEPLDPTVFPGAMEVPLDGIDQDCDGADACWLDGDGDGAGGPGTVPATTADCSGPGEAATSDDCDDMRADVGPQAVEVCDEDDVDEDCDGLADDADPDVTGQVRFYVDGDGDGFADASTPSRLACDPQGPAEVADVGDCDDSDPEVHPGADERCLPAGVDDDCDGLLDDADTDVVDGLVGPPDADGDGLPGEGERRWCVLPDFGDTLDCDDRDPTVGGPTSWYADADGDGWGGEPPVLACEAPPAHVDRAGDCDDTRAGVRPDADDVADDGIDQNCSGVDRQVAWSSGAGCGCVASPSPGGWLVGLLLVSALPRRRRA